MAALSWFGVCPGTIAAEYESDMALREWTREHPGFKGFPPSGHYFWAAWSAELDLRSADDDSARKGLDRCPHDGP